jgi:hypothetical protein
MFSIGQEHRSMILSAPLIDRPKPKSAGETLRRCLSGLALALAVASPSAGAEPRTIANPNVAAKAVSAKSVEATPAPAAKKTKKSTAWPAFSAVQKSAEKHFSTLKKYRKGDLLSQGDVEPVFAELEKLGWKVADREQIVKLVPGDRELMVRMLRTEDGRTFMRDIERLPGGYDRVDHLSRLSDAETLLWRLTSGPDGYKMIDYMTETPYGANMGQMLSQAPNGKGFNKPTGRIYTETQFIARLKQSHASAEKARAKHKPVAKTTR